MAETKEAGVETFQMRGISTRCLQIDSIPNHIYFSIQQIKLLLIDHKTTILKPLMNGLSKASMAILTDQIINDFPSFR